MIYGVEFNYQLTKFRFIFGFTEVLMVELTPYG